MAQLAAARGRAGTIDPVNLKYMLGDIQTNVIIFSMDGSPLCDFRQPHFGTLRCRGRRPSTTSGQVRISHLSRLIIIYISRMSFDEFAEKPPGYGLVATEIADAAHMIRIYDRFPGNVQSLSL